MYCTHIYHGGLIKKDNNTVRNHLHDLRGLETFSNFFTIFYKGDNFCDLLLLFRTPLSFWQGYTLKGKNLLPLGAMGANSVLLE